MSRHHYYRFMKISSLSRAFICLLCLFTLTSCDFGSSGGGGGPPEPQTILVMGDSISQGGFYGETPWPSVLDGMVAEWTVVNRARGGEQMQDGAARMPGILASVNPDSVVIFYGSNNAIQGRLAEFEGGLRNAIQFAQNAGASRVVVCTIPPMFGGRAIFNGNVDTLNQIIPSIASELGAGVAYVDREFDRNTDVDLFPDGLHPDTPGHVIIAMTVRERL